MRRSLSWGSCTALAVLGTGPSAIAQCQYEPAILQVPGAYSTSGRAINDNGDITGSYSTIATSDEPFRWTAEKGFETLLRPAGFEWARGVGIDNRGIAVGWITSANPVHDYAAMWLEPDELLLLGIPPGGDGNEAAAINELGQIAGTWWNSVDGPYHAFLWDGRLIDLQDDFSTLRSSGADINEHGQIAGWMGISSAIDATVFIWDDGTVLDLGNIPGAFTGFPRGINNRGQITGEGWLMSKEPPPLYTKHAFFWDGQQMLDLGTLPGFGWSHGWDVNDAGIVVGNCTQGDGLPNTAFIWQGGVMTALNDLVAESGFTVPSATGINKRGQIVGKSNAGTYILTPIDQPAGDANCDCRSDVQDLIMVIQDWGKRWSAADLNDDGTVETADLILVILSWS